MMISDFAIKRPIVTVTVMLALVVFGVFSLTQLDTDEFPDVVAPVVTTTVIYPGASPDVVEREVTDPIEEAISGISGWQPRHHHYAGCASSARQAPSPGQKQRCEE
jgi:HAE1 family hydrophobic/amphiphilic exporter-1